MASCQRDAVGYHQLLFWRTPQNEARGESAHKDPFKAAVAELLLQDSKAPATVITPRLKTLGFDGGITIVKDYRLALRKSQVARRAYVRMEPGAGEHRATDFSPGRVIPRHRLPRGTPKTGH